MFAGSNVPRAHPHACKAFARDAGLGHERPKRQCKASYFCPLAGQGPKSGVWGKHPARSPKLLEPVHGWFHQSAWGLWPQKPKGRRATWLSCPCGDWAWSSQLSPSCGSAVQMAQSMSTRQKSQKPAMARDSVLIAGLRAARLPWALRPTLREAPSGLRPPRPSGPNLR